MPSLLLDLTYGCSSPPSLLPSRSTPFPVRRGRVLAAVLHAAACLHGAAMRYVWGTRVRRQGGGRGSMYGRAAGERSAGRSPRMQARTFHLSSPSAGVLCHCFLDIGPQPASHKVQAEPAVPASSHPGGEGGDWGGGREGRTRRRKKRKTKNKKRTTKPRRATREATLAPTHTTYLPT